jgi:hypothetical protein
MSPKKAATLILTPQDMSVAALTLVCPLGVYRVLFSNPQEGYQRIFRHRVG